MTIHYDIAALAPATPPQKRKARGRIFKIRANSIVPTAGGRPLLGGIERRLQGAELSASACAGRKEARLGVRDLTTGWNLVAIASVPVSIGRPEQALPRCSCRSTRAKAERTPSTCSGCIPWPPAPRWAPGCPCLTGRATAHRQSCRQRAEPATRPGQRAGPESSCHQKVMSVGRLRCGSRSGFSPAGPAGRSQSDSRRAWHRVEPTIGSRRWSQRASLSQAPPPAPPVRFRLRPRPSWRAAASKSSSSRSGGRAATPIPVGLSCWAVWWNNCSRSTGIARTVDRLVAHTWTAIGVKHHSSARSAVRSLDRLQRSHFALPQITDTRRVGGPAAHSSGLQLHPPQAVRPGQGPPPGQPKPFPGAAAAVNADAPTSRDHQAPGGEGCAAPCNPDGPLRFATGAENGGPLGFRSKVAATAWAAYVRGCRQPAQPKPLQAGRIRPGDSCAWAITAKAPPAGGAVAQASR